MRPWLAVLLFVHTLGMVSRAETEWVRLPSLPDPLGVAAPFAGVSRGGLLVAGGAHFPDKMPWDGGVKEWTARMWYLPDAQGTWIDAGDDGSLAGFRPLDKHPGFPGVVYEYDGVRDRWETLGHAPAPRVTLPCVQWGSLHVLVSGEVRPGVRSSEIWAFKK